MARRNDKPFTLWCMNRQSDCPMEGQVKITRISVFQVDLPLYESSYKWSGGKLVEVFDSTVVRIETDARVSGHGEVCPIGPAYLPWRFAHLAHGTPPEFLFTATDFNSYVTVNIADGAPRRVRGRMVAPAAPGLGVARASKSWENRCWSSADRIEVGKEWPALLRQLDHAGMNDYCA